eukprot:scaffold60269_cov51-Attheya_sp.AAC.6
MRGPAMRTPTCCLQGSPPFVSVQGFSLAFRLSLNDALRFTIMSMVGPFSVVLAACNRWPSAQNNGINADLIGRDKSQELLGGPKGFLRARLQPSLSDLVFSLDFREPPERTVCGCECVIVLHRRCTWVSTTL